MKTTASARTQQGSARERNGDAAVCRAEQGLFAVVDGMGSAEAASISAALTAAALADVPALPGLTSETLLVSALKTARSRILQKVADAPDIGEIGAVATAIRLEDDGSAAALAHVGDARAWHVSARGVRQLTTDHVASAGEGGKPPVVRDLGRPTLEGDWVETCRFRVRRNDLLVLATDGLADAVPADVLARTLDALWRSGASADGTTARLLQVVAEHGGRDNATVVAVRVGRFRRGGRSRRLGLPVTLLLFAAIAALALSVRYGRTPPPLVELPDRVTDATRFGSAPDATVEAGKHTTVLPGARFEVRGAAVRGYDWQVDVQEGARFELSLARVELEGGLVVNLAPRATLFLHDAVLRAGSMRVVSAAGAEVILEDVVFDLAGAGPGFEGPVLPTTRGVVSGMHPGRPVEAP